MATIYNEIDAACCAILAEQIASGVIAPGRVEQRSIKELTADDLRDTTQAHFFAGGGLWSVAARMAGWPDDRPLWTASCPCQPFSQAGKQRGTADERHLWPDLFRLVRAVRPPVLVGEQVAGAAGYGWFDGVRADLESEGYACRAVDVPACAVDAPHIRQRLYWVALAKPNVVSGGCGTGRRNGAQTANPSGAQRVALDDAVDARLEGLCRHGDREIGRTVTNRSATASDGGCDVAYTYQSFRRVGDQQSAGELAVHEQDAGNALRAGSRYESFWSGAEWLSCHNGKARRTKPGLRLLVDGLPGRVGLWRVAGNAIVPQVAAQVLAALMETM